MDFRRRKIWTMFTNKKNAANNLRRGIDTDSINPTPVFANNILTPCLPSPYSIDYTLRRSSPLPMRLKANANHLPFLLRLEAGITEFPAPYSPNAVQKLLP